MRHHTNFDGAVMAQIVLRHHYGAPKEKDGAFALRHHLFPDGAPMAQQRAWSLLVITGHVGRAGILAAISSSRAQNLHSLERRWDILGPQDDMDWK